MPSLQAVYDKLGLEIFTRINMRVKVLRISAPQLSPVAKKGSRPAARLSA